MKKISSLFGIVLMAACGPNGTPPAATDNNPPNPPAQIESKPINGLWTTNVDGQMALFGSADYVLEGNLWQANISKLKLEMHDYLRVMFKTSQFDEIKPESLSLIFYCESRRGYDGPSQFVLFGSQGRIQRFPNDRGYFDVGFKNQFPLLELDNSCVANGAKLIEISFEDKSGQRMQLLSELHPSINKE